EPDDPDEHRNAEYHCAAEDALVGLGKCLPPARDPFHARDSAPASDRLRIANPTSAPIMPRAPIPPRSPLRVMCSWKRASASMRLKRLSMTVATGRESVGVPAW